MTKNIKYINSKVVDFKDNKIFFENGSILIITSDFKFNGEKIKGLFLSYYEISDEKIKFNFENKGCIEIITPYSDDEVFCVINTNEKYRCLLTKDNILGEWIGLNE